MHPIGREHLAFHPDLERPGLRHADDERPHGVRVGGIQGALIPADPLVGTARGVVLLCPGAARR